MQFPNYQKSLQDKTIFTPEELVKYKKTANIMPSFIPPKGVIISYQRSLMNYIAKKESIKSIYGFFGDLYLLKKTNYQVGIIGNFGVGAPVTVSIMEELGALGVTNFISLDMAGALSKELAIGDIFVCNSAVRDEGTSFHYMEGTKVVQASNNLVTLISNLLDDRKIRYITGSSWTTDAPFRETLHEILEYQKQGVKTVEMAISAAFAVGQLREWQVAGLFTITDSVADLVWHPETDTKKTWTSLQIIYDIAVQTLFAL